MHNLKAIISLALFAFSVPVQARTADEIFQQWLVEWNSGDSRRIEAFYKANFPNIPAAPAIDTASATCGFAIENYLQKSDGEVSVLLREKCNSSLDRVRVETPAKEGVTANTLTLTLLRLSPEVSDAEAFAYADRLAQAGQFAGSLVIAPFGKPVLSKSWGRFPQDESRSITLDTPMYLASAGKMFTGVAILQLMEQGKLELDAPLGRYLPDYPNADMAKVTLRQLLQHRGGTGSSGTLARDEGAARKTAQTIGEVIALNGQRGPLFPPGSRSDYSNYGFILLGAVVESVSGQSYYDYVEQNVFQRAGMRNAGFPTRAEAGNVPLGLTSFYGEEEGLHSNADVLPWRGLPDGGGVASANDLKLFFDALNADRLLQPDTLKLALTAGDAFPFGLGFIAVDRLPVKSFGHGGNSYGMDVAASQYEDVGRVFICTAIYDHACNKIIQYWGAKAYGPTQ